MPSQSSSSDDDFELLDDRHLDSLNAEYIGTWLPDPSAGDSCARCKSYSSIVSSPYFRYSDVEIDGYYTYQQIIKIVDDTNPVISVSSMDTIYRSQTNIDASNPCEFMGAITAEASDFCSDDILAENEVLSWHVIVNGFSRELAEPLSRDTLIGSGREFEVLLTSEFDRYDLLWSVADACQNLANARSTVYVQDHSVSAPICLGVISLGSIDQSGITLHAEDLVISELMDCDEIAILGLSLDGDGQDIVDQLDLSCEELNMSDSLILRLWSVDRFDNRNFCQVIIRYRMDVACVDSSITLSGTVNTIFGEEMSNVEVGLFDTNQQVLSAALTDVQGRYLLDSMIDQSAYVQAAYDNASLQGVSTLDIILLQQYVLGLIDIDNPYLLWAGDINRDGRISALDITLLRSAILGIGEGHGVGDWIFLDADQLVSPSRPIGANSDIIDIADLGSMDETLDLLGLKYGDLSGDSYLAGQRSHVEDVRVQYSSKQSALNETKTLELEINHVEAISGFDIRLDVNVIGDITIHSDDVVIRSTDYAVNEVGGIRLIWVNSAQTHLESISLSITVEEDNVLDHEMVSGSLWSSTLQEYNMLLSVEDQSNLPVVSVHPNPFAHTAKLRVNGLSGERMDLKIYDGMGRLIKKYDDLIITDDSLFTIDAESLDGRGLYYYVIEGETTSLSGSFIVL